MTWQEIIRQASGVNLLDVRVFGALGLDEVGRQAAPLLSRNASTALCVALTMQCLVGCGCGGWQSIGAWANDPANKAVLHIPERVTWRTDTAVRR